MHLHFPLEFLYFPLSVTLAYSWTRLMAKQIKKILNWNKKKKENHEKFHFSKSKNFYIAIFWKCSLKKLKFKTIKVFLNYSYYLFLQLFLLSLSLEECNVAQFLRFNLISNCNCKSMIILVSNNDNPTELQTTAISLLLFVTNIFIIESHTSKTILQQSNLQSPANTNPRLQ